MMKHTIQWMAPSPFWKPAASAADPGTPAEINRPAVLRFATDSFMDDFVALLENDPIGMAALSATAETWRGPAAVAEPVEQLPPLARSLNRSRLARMRAANGAIAPGDNGSLTVASALAPLKLYQPSHQRYYLIGASLVCRMTGFPDHPVDPGRHEKASFVVRRLMPSPGGTAICSAATCDEYGFVATPSGNQWQKIANGADLLPGEDRSPLSAMSFVDDDGRNRRVYVGLIPVSNREQYTGASQSDPATGPTGTDPDSRLILFQKQVTGPWSVLSDQANEVAARIGLPPNPAPADSTARDAQTAATQAVKKGARERTQVASWYILIDFARFLQQYVPNVWATVSESGAADASSLSSPELALLNALSTMIYTDPVGHTSMSLAGALRNILHFETRLETVSGVYHEDSPDPLWPTFRFAFADPDPNAVQGAPSNGALNTLLSRALPAEKPAGLPPPSLAAQTPLDIGGPSWFVIRCVYERPDCGPLDPPVISEPSATFQMAAFFDPDAPARPIRIGLPIDTSPAGLRKFDKNTAFMISDVLCGQMQALGNLSLGDLVLSVLPWPFHKDLNVDPSAGKPCGGADSFGFMCSFSIPIITICAIILLMIMVKLFDIFFSWMVFFRICFPLPKFKAKS